MYKRLVPHLYAMNINVHKHHFFLQKKSLDTIAFQSSVCTQLLRAVHENVSLILKGSCHVGLNQLLEAQTSTWTFPKWMSMYRIDRIYRI